MNVIYTALCLWLLLASSSPPIALVIAMLATPTVFQMLFGRPKIDIGFTDVNDNLLLCTFRQPSVTGPMRALQVRRQPIEMYVSTSIIRIKLGGIQEMVTLNPMTELLHSPSGETARMMTVAASAIPVIQGIVAEYREAGVLCKDELWRDVVLSPGDYRAEIMAFYGDQDIARGIRRFRVTDRGVHWMAES